MEMDDNKRYHCKIKKKKGSIYFLSPPLPPFPFFRFPPSWIGFLEPIIYIYPRWNYIINFCQKS